MTPIEEFFLVIRWWGALMVLGTAVVPLAWQLLPTLPDRGYAFSKLLGLLLTSYLFWLLGSLGMWANNVGSILFALALVIGLSAWAWQQNRTELTVWLKQNWRYIVVVELIFLLFYLLWVWVRAQNPAIVATEKPMDFAFLNAIGRSSSFPPLDPWLSGYAISYYYFGYLMNSVLAQLTAVPEPYAFNLALAWLVAGTAVAAFGLVYNLIVLHKATAQRTAVAFGLVAALAIPLAGNLEILLEVAHGYNYGSADFWEWLDVRDLNQPPNPEAAPRYEHAFWWWWRASRPINEYSLAGERIEGLEPIVEFPAFSFVLGDLHPHVMALPFAFLSLAVALVWFRRELAPTAVAEANMRWQTADWPQRPWLLLQEVGWPLWLLTAVVLGGLSFLNTWDVLIHLFVMLAAYTIAQWRQVGQWTVVASKVGLMALLLAGTAVALYLPFYIGFRSQAGAPFLLPMLNQPTRLAQFWVVFGMPLLVVTVLLLALAAQQRFRYWRQGVGTAVGLLLLLYVVALLFSWIVASSAEGAGRVLNLATELGITLAPSPDTRFAPGWGATAVAALLPAYLQARLALPGLTLYLGGLLALAVMLLLAYLNSPTAVDEPNEAAAEEPVTEASLPPSVRAAPSVALPFVLLLVITAVLLTIGPEFVYLRDNFGVRLNTIFKFYYQAWALFGVSAVVGLYLLWQATAVAVGRLVAVGTAVAYGLLLAVALLFPFYAVQSRTQEFRGSSTATFRQPPTLNGLASMQNGNLDEYEAIQWLRQTVKGTPVILEAVGGQYSQYGRVSASTGLPTLLGWAGHERQWRGNSTNEPNVRESVVQAIYSAPSWQGSAAAELLNRHKVELIYIGSLERTTYNLAGDNLQKFADRLEVAYQNGSVTIYRWLPEK